MICITCKNFINGGWLESSTTFESLNPADCREAVGLATNSTEVDVDRAVAAARAAYPKWRALGSPKRAEAIDGFAQAMKRYGREIAKYITLETGKPAVEAAAEIQQALATAQYLAGMGRVPSGLVAESEASTSDSYVIRRPRGVIACVTPGFSPVAVPLSFVLPSLLAGNTVVWKPSEQTPVAAQWLSRVFLEAGFMEGAINIVHGFGGIVGHALAHHRDVATVLFGGSQSTAVALRRTFAEYPNKSLHAETSAVNALIVLKDADIELAAKAAVTSAFRTAGQRWNSADRIFVESEVEAEFSERFVDKVRTLKIGPGSAPETSLGPMLSQDDCSRAEKIRDGAKAAAHEILYAGELPADDTCAEGAFVAPFVYRLSLDTYKEAMPEESRCPCVAVVPVDGAVQAVAAYNIAPAKLALSVFTEDFRKWRWIRDNADFGQGYCNLPTVGGEIQLPVGSEMGSAGGHPHPMSLFDAVTYRKSLTVGNESSR